MLYYKNQAVVGIHGVYLIQQNFKTYYQSRIVFHHQLLNPYDLYVHILGTGALGFYTKNFRISPHEFKYPNMADIWLGRLGQKAKIPFICLKRILSILYKEIQYIIAAVRNSAMKL